MKKTSSVADWLAFARQQLADAAPAQTGDLDFPSLQAEVLMAYVTGQPRVWVLTHPEAPIPSSAADTLDRLLTRRLAGEPLPYLIGHWEFYGLDFQVTPDVLIPRPETELLVEEALGWLRANPTRRRAADIGAGSGCIGISLAKNIPALRVTCVDVSSEALEIARQNTRVHAVDNHITLVQSDLLSTLTGPFDLICANLPYIPHAKLADLPVAQFEPLLALDGGVDGLDQVRRLLEQAPACLTPGALLLLEIESGQGESAPQIAHRVFPSAEVSVRADLAGLPRLLRIETHS